MSIRIPNASLLVLAVAALGASIPGCTHTDIEAANFMRQQRKIPVELEGEPPEQGV